MHYLCQDYEIHVADLPFTTAAEQIQAGRSQITSYFQPVPSTSGGHQLSADPVFSAKAEANTSVRSTRLTRAVRSMLSQLAPPNLILPTMTSSQSVSRIRQQFGVSFRSRCSQPDTAAVSQSAPWAGFETFPTIYPEFHWFFKKPVTSSVASSVTSDQ